MTREEHERLKEELLRRSMWNAEHFKRDPDTDQIFWPIASLEDGLKKAGLI